MKQSVRFDIHHPGLCPALRWKGQFTATEEDPTIPSTRDNLYWCVYTQACVGPDNKLVEPHLCSAHSRSCHRQAVRILKSNES